MYDYEPMLKLLISRQGLEVDETGTQIDLGNQMARRVVVKMVTLVGSVTLVAFDINGTEISTAGSENRAFTIRSAGETQSRAVRFNKIGLVSVGGTNVIDLEIYQ